MPSRGTLDREDALPSTFVSSSSSGNDNMANANGSSTEKSSSSSSSVRLRKTLAVRPQEDLEEEEEDEDAIEEEEEEEDSDEEDKEEEEEEDGSDVIEASVVSSVTDRYGFMGGGPHDEGGGGGAEEEEDGEEDDSDGAKRRRKQQQEQQQQQHRSWAELQRRREAKWLDMLDHWDAFMMRNYKKVRERCRKGIPSSVRARAWLHLCGAKYHLMNPENKTEFKRLYNQRGQAKWLDQIERDLHRNFPTHEMFGGAYERIGQAELFRVLKAYSVLNPVDGYCQAMAPVAAVLLMHMPAESAFWCLVSLCDKYIPGYYSPGMEAIRLDGDILFGLLRKVSPAAHRHLLKQEIDPVLYMTEWFLCAFGRTLPWPAVLRTWDMFMCEGVKVLFRVGLVLMRTALGTRSARKSCPSMYETLEAIKAAPSAYKDPEQLVEEVVKLNISEVDMEREHRKQLKKRKKAAKQKEREKKMAAAANKNNN